MTYIAVHMKLRLTVTADSRASLGFCTFSSLALVAIGLAIGTSNWAKNLGAAARLKTCGFPHEGKYI